MRESLPGYLTHGDAVVRRAERSARLLLAMCAMPERIRVEESRIPPGGSN